MHVQDDIELLQKYAKGHAETAFSALVERHLGLVHSAAWRQVHDSQLAEEVTQAVFIALARKASTFRPGIVLPAWLYRATRYAASNVLKAERRRRQRESEVAQMQMETNSTSDSAWKEIAPFLEQAMTKLREKDRAAVLLRYFENKSLAEVGVALRTTEEAAKKRLARALQRLKAIFLRHGVVLSAAGLGSLLSANGIQAVPVALATSMKALPLFGGASAAASTLALAKTTLNMLAWANVKNAAAIGAGVLLLGGAVGFYSSQGTMAEPPPEPVYQGRTLRQWAVSLPRGGGVMSNEDIQNLRQAALIAMGRPAIRYLHWLVLHPEEISRGMEHQPSPQASNSQSWFMSPGVPGIVMALHLVGSRARSSAADLVRLWESNFSDPDSPRPLSMYNGFPITLAVLGDSSPPILAALHRHFKSPNRLHGVLCAFAAWRLNPQDAEAVDILHRELRSTDPESYPRHALLDTFSGYATNATPFLSEIRALLGRETNPNLQDTDAKAAWRLLHRAEPAKALLKRLGEAASAPEATPEEVNRFAAAALTVAEVPGANELSKPLLKKLTSYPDDSAAKFASNILAKLEQKAD
jgi:RNA polymerase sigma factor (sigma-70 family)